jgi:hypothetical protein
MGESRRREATRRRNQSRNRRRPQPRARPQQQSHQQTYPSPKRPGVALGLSIAGLVIPILAPVAWIFASFALLDHRGTPAEPMTRAAKILAILGTLLLILEATLALLLWS